MQYRQKNCREEQFCWWHDIEINKGRGQKDLMTRKTVKKSRVKITRLLKKVESRLQQLCVQTGDLQWLYRVSGRWKEHRCLHPQGAMSVLVSWEACDGWSQYEALFLDFDEILVDYMDAMSKKVINNIFAGWKGSEVKVGTPIAELSSLLDPVKTEGCHFETSPLIWQAFLRKMATYI